MIVLSALPAYHEAAAASLSPLNAAWCGPLPEAKTLPQLGHLHLLLPLSNTAVSCAQTLVNPDQYLLLTPAETRPLTLAPAWPDADARLILLWLSPGFIAEIAAFLDIDPALGDLLSTIPLPQGDTLSCLLGLLAAALEPPFFQEEVEDLALEIVGEVLRHLRYRQRTVLSLAPHRTDTAADLLPRLLQARQFIAANYASTPKMREVAAHVALSEYHFARLFKAAFGETVHQFGLRLRLDEARRLLEVTNTAVTDVAFAIGYRSLSAFNRAFRLRFGQTPTAYRNRFQQTQS